MLQLNKFEITHRWPFAYIAKSQTESEKYRAQTSHQDQISPRRVVLHEWFSPANASLHPFRSPDAIPGALRLHLALVRDIIREDSLQSEIFSDANLDRVSSEESRGPVCNRFCQLGRQVN